MPVSAVKSIDVTKADDPAANKRQPKFKKFVKSTVSIHDRTQIETVFDYYLYRGAAKALPRQLSYRVEAFLFYPKQFGLDPQSYPKERFYNDVRPLIRFREPRLSYKQLLGIKPTAQSPLTSLSLFIDKAIAGERGLDIDLAVNEVRLFACSLIGNFMRNLDRRRKRFQALRRHALAAPVADIAKAVHRMQRILCKLGLVLHQYRLLVEKAEALPGSSLRTSLLGEMRLVDEYLYYRLRDGLVQLFSMCSELGKACGAGHTDALRQELLQLMEREDAYAERRCFMRIREDSSTELKERYMHRRGELKRRIWQVLFLEIRTTPLFAFQQQIGAMVAAGLAAFWAVFAQILLIRQSGLTTTEFFRSGGLVLITAAILAYVIKDRIKEFGRSYFRGRVFRALPDQSEVIYYQDRAVGRNRESSKFLSLQQLPPEVLNVRSMAVAKAHDNAEDVSGVLYYSKDMHLNRDIKILDNYPLKAVHDILRINIDACLARLGEPTQVHHLVRDDGHVQPILLPKVYYLDMALRYSKRAIKGRQAQERLDYFRLVVDKNGLLRIDQLAEVKLGDESLMSEAQAGSENIT